MRKLSSVQGMAKGRILIVDDEPTVSEVVGEHLQDLGYTVESVPSGEDALERLRTQRYDMVFLDILLPGMDGIEVARRLRADPALRDIPLAFLTVLGESANVLDGFEVGGNAYVVKPLDLGRIEEVVGLLTKETTAH